MKKHLDYGQAPIPRRNSYWARWVVLEGVLCFCFVAAFCWALDRDVTCIEVLMAPIAWAAHHLNRDVTAEQVVLASGIFWASPISFWSLRKRRANRLTREEERTKDANYKH